MNNHYTLKILLFLVGVLALEGILVYNIVV